MASAQGPNGLAQLSRRAAGTRRPFLHHLRWIGLLAAVVAAVALAWPPAAAAQEPTQVTASERHSLHSNITSPRGIARCRDFWYVAGGAAIYYVGNDFSLATSVATIGRHRRGLGCDEANNQLYDAVSGNNLVYRYPVDASGSLGTASSWGGIGTNGNNVAVHGAVVHRVETSVAGWVIKREQVADGSDVGDVALTRPSGYTASEEAFAVDESHYYLAATNGSSENVVIRFARSDGSHDTGIEFKLSGDSDVIAGMHRDGVFLYVVELTDDEVEVFGLNEPPAWATGAYTYRVSADAAIGDEVADLSSSLSDPEDDTITCSLERASSYVAVSSACVLTVADDLSDLAVLAVTVQATDGTSTVERQVTIVITPVDPDAQTGETGAEGTGGVSPADIRDATVPRADDSSIFGVLVRPTVEVMGLGAGSGAWLSIMVAICAGGLVYRLWPRIEVSSGVGLIVLLTATMAGLMPWWFFGVGTIVHIMGFLMVQSAWDR